MTPIQTALSVLLIIVIVLLVLAVFVPAGLEKLSRANRARFEASTRELAERRSDVSRFADALRPYDDVHSVTFREVARSAGDEVASLARQLGVIEAALANLRTPTVFDYLFPIQHFIILPGDIPAILSDALQLRHNRSALAAAATTGERVVAAIATFDALPARLMTTHEALARRLTALENTIQREREEGIIALDDLTRGANKAQNQLHIYRGETDRNVTKGGPAVAYDSGATALETAAAALDDAEERAAWLVEHRTALDKQMRRISDELNALLTREPTPSGGGNRPGADDRDKIYPLLRNAAVLINNSAADHRQRREFTAATADVTAAARLIAVARDLFETAQAHKILANRDEGGALNMAIITLRDDLAEQYYRLQQGVPLGENIDDLAGQASALRERGEALLERQNAAIVALEEEVRAMQVRLEASWAAAQEQLSLAQDDPYARKRRELLEEFKRTQRRPAELEQFRRNVAGFEAELRAWAARTGRARARISRMQGETPILIDSVLLSAAPWKCFNQDVAFIQQRAANFKTVRLQFNAATHSSDAETLMKELEEIERDIHDRKAQIEEQIGRLRFLENDVERVVELSRGDVAAYPAEHPDRMRWDKTLRIIEHHVKTAHEAPRYDDASVALTRASNIASQVRL